VGCEFLIVELSVSVGIESGEVAMQLDVMEDAAEGLKSLLGFTKLDEAVAIKVEMLEDLLHSLALVITMGALSDLLENDNLDLLHCRGDMQLVSREASSLQDKINEVIVLLSGESGVHISVVVNECLLRDEDT
jgi:hypothetical protein